MSIIAILDMKTVHTKTLRQNIQIAASVHLQLRVWIMSKTVCFILFDVEDIITNRCAWIRVANTVRIIENYFLSVLFMI